ncbi:hypothetical protein [Microbispora rosea]|uniref:hypothetical protein n=1 Tax=Microbispora rosea TaxID=58117 RepID=UPI003D94323B
MISVTDAYRVLGERRDADHNSSTTAVDAFTAIALGMSAGEHHAARLTGPVRAAAGRGGPEWKAEGRVRMRPDPGRSVPYWAKC